MFVFDGLMMSSRTVQLRARQLNCQVCGDCPSITSLIDYQEFCGAAESCEGPVILSNQDRISPHDYNSMLKTGESHLVLDVRPRTEFEICHLGGAFSILSRTRNIIASGVSVGHCFLKHSLDIPLKTLHSDLDGSILKIRSNELCTDSVKTGWYN